MGVLVPLERQIECVRRELGYRDRCYVKWVRDGRMSQDKANDELECMRAVLETLQRIDEKERLL